MGTLRCAGKTRRKVTEIARRKLLMRMRRCACILSEAWNGCAAARIRLKTFCLSCRRNIRWPFRPPSEAIVSAHDDNMQSVVSMLYNAHRS